MPSSPSFSAEADTAAAPPDSAKAASESSPSSKEAKPPLAASEEACASPFVTANAEDATPVAEAEAEAEARELAALGAMLGGGTPTDPTRYAALRAMGLSAREAFLAASADGAIEALGRARSTYAALLARGTAAADGGKAHMKSAVSDAASGTPPMPHSLLIEARELFGDLPDGELARLYRRASGEDRT